MAGLSAIPPSEIEAWARLKWIDLHPWEVECILMQDRIKRTVHAQRSRKN